LQRGFHDDHRRRYRGRPIYFLASSGRRRAFQALIYVHAYTRGIWEPLLTSYLEPHACWLEARCKTAAKGSVQQTDAAADLREVKAFAARLARIAAASKTLEPGADARAVSAELRRLFSESRGQEMPVAAAC